MGKDSTSFNKKFYNVFSVCQEFRQRLAELQRLTSVKKKEKKKSSLNK